MREKADAAAYSPKHEVVKSAGRPLDFHADSGFDSQRCSTTIGLEGKAQSRGRQKYLMQFALATTQGVA